MNIQSVNQNRQQNFGMKFKVVAPEAKKAATERAANKVLKEINRKVSPKLRGELTDVMKLLGDNTIVRVQPTRLRNTLLLSEASRGNTTYSGNITTISSPSKRARAIIGRHASLWETDKFAETEGTNLLTYLKSLRAGLTGSVPSEEELAKEINFIA